MGSKRIATVMSNALICAQAALMVAAVAAVIARLPADEQTAATQPQVAAISLTTVAQ